METGRQRLREERVKGYFIEAARRILLEKGLEAITVKAVAEAAGYAPGTLYNYFPDLQALLRSCAALFFGECSDRVREEAERQTDPVERLVRPALVYQEYFLERPAVFRLVFLEPLGSPDELLDRDSGLRPEAVDRALEHLRECAEAGIIPAEALGPLSGIVPGVVHSNLLFYMNGRSPGSEEELKERTERELRFLLGGMKR